MIELHPEHLFSPTTMGFMFVTFILACLFIVALMVFFDSLGGFRPTAWTARLASTVVAILASYFFAAAIYWNIYLG